MVERYGDREGEIRADSGGEKEGEFGSSGEGKWEGGKEGGGVKSLVLLKYMCTLKHLP